MTAHHRTPEWARVRRQVKPVIAASLPQPCIDCGWPVYADQRWQVGHRVPVAVARRMGWTVAEMNAPSNLGPTHAGRCNQRAGGKLAHQLKRLDAKPPAQRNSEYPAW